MLNEHDRQIKVSIHLPFSTILFILATLLAIHLLEGLAPLLMPLFIGSLLAVALHPILLWLERRRIPRWLAILTITLSLFIVMSAVVATLIPRLVAEFTSLIEHLPQMREDLLNYLNPNNPLRPLIEQNLNRHAIFPRNYDVGRFYSVGSKAFGGLTEVVLVFVFAIYLMVDGVRTIQWATAFLSPEKRDKTRRTLAEVSEIIFAYASGQFITSFLSFLYTFLGLTALSVPAALLLATLAGLFDVLPVLGFFLAVIPAMIFALRVSTETALFVLALYIVYHILENYWIVPWVYGNRLRLSGLTVLLATLGAGFLAGIEGAISILPIVASYPIVEKIWLRPIVGTEVIEKHKELNQTEKTPDSL